ncbi:MAG TPA: Hsp20/alpha crystallin family protein [Polyangiaceae bacterium]|nr:Hsp20/alpha crystallin family protein [Polyangiaceae bacterium]
MIVRRIGRAEPRWSRSISSQSNPFQDFDRIRREMFRFLDSYPGEDGSSAGVFPAMNVTQDRDNYYVRAELPGVKPSDLEITAMQRTLSIAGKRATPELEGVSYHRKERVDGEFNRSVTLPGDFDGERVDARCVHGVLTVTLPKPERAKPRQISVKTA